MNEAEKPGPIERLDSIQDVERLLLEAANAIQRLVAERDTLRRRVDTLENELARLGERTGLIHDSYRSLATEFVTQLRRLDGEVAELREPVHGERPPEQQSAETGRASNPMPDTLGPE
jgi:hypothetical protein